MSSQDDYEPSQDLGDSQLVLDHTESRARKAGAKAVVSMTRFYEAGGDAESQYIERIQYGNDEALAEAENGSVQPSSTTRKATEHEDSSLSRQTQELLTENTMLKEALLRSRERGMHWLQFYASLKAVEVEAERRYKDVGTILEGLGYEVPVYPQRMGNEDITRETERWRVMFTERWMEMERAEEAMFLPKPTDYSVDGRFVASLKVKQELQLHMKSNGENVSTGENEWVGLKRKRMQL